ncbi:AcrR family transcriptional regulator [Marmoricola sp. OAE513]|uniref:TetR/AcrR family transcriptional regulator n=1 Tax=Marmoricola sp. OAE513 TaxID=2817894 RepID=UPI0033958D7E
MTGLSAKGAATRARLVEGASELMRAEGVVNTTLDDVLARTGTSKGQLFHYFPGGREELLLAIAELEAARVLSDQEPHLSRLDSWPAWDAWRHAVVSRYKAQGPDCPLHALMVQVNVSSPGSHAVIIELMRAWEQALRDGIETMQATGQIDRSHNPAAAAKAIVAVIQGGVQVLMATGDAQHLETALDLTLAGLKTPPEPRAGHHSGGRQGLPR